MKITFKCDYALRALLDLAFRYIGNDIVPLTDISARQNIPEKYLEQIMLVLKKAGYVTSRRGSGGGFYLAKSPELITVGDIIRAIEGPLDFVINHDTETNHESNAFREVWMKVTDATTAIVDTVTFADIMRRTNELRAAQSDYTFYI